MAGERYEVIRAGLIRIFIAKGFSDPEDLADETINRVMIRLPDIRDSYVGDPARYFWGVARYIILEAIRRREIATEEIPIAWNPVVHIDDTTECLRRCLKFLPTDKRELILDYYIYEGKDKIENHRIMASELDITKGALRTKVHHIRNKLEKCVLQCTAKLGRNKNGMPAHKQ